MNRVPNVRYRPRSTPPGAGNASESNPISSKADLEDTDAAIRKPKKDYVVGNCRPPIETRFGGPRANSSGRRKGSKSRRTIIQEEFDAKVDVPGHGKMAKFRLAIRQLVNQAAKGELRAISAMMKLAAEHDRDAPKSSVLEASRESVDEELTPAGLAILDIFEEQVRANERAALGANSAEGGQ